MLKADECSAGQVDGSRRKKPSFPRLSCIFQECRLKKSFLFRLREKNGFTVKALNSCPMCAFLLCAIPLKFGRAGREDIWVMTHGRRCALSVSHGFWLNIFLLGPPTQSLSTLYFEVVYRSSLNDTDFLHSYCGEY